MLNSINEKYMSDEETDEKNTGFLIQRSPKWRNQLVTKLLAKVDENIKRMLKMISQDL